MASLPRSGRMQKTKIPKWKVSMGMFFNQSLRFKQMKPLVQEFFRTLQGLLETEMEKAASHILYFVPLAK